MKTPSGFAIWNLGFRPFYLVAGIYATAAVPFWLGQYAGYLPHGFTRSMSGHAHEMFFGYTLAVVTGFLFTAVRAWTGQATPTGPLLAAFVALWSVGRVLAVTPFESAAALVDTAFVLAVAIAITIPLLRSRNRRNYFLVFVLFLFGLAALADHLSIRRLLDVPAWSVLQAALDLMLFIIAVIAGRVVPMFTSNGVPGVRTTRNALVEKAALGGVLVLIVADLTQAPSNLIAVLALVVALAHAARLYLWQPWRTTSHALVWILHASYGWIVAYLVLRALSAAGLVALPVAIHALTIGAIGGMTLGMMTRTARGHTGRPLEADGFESACFVLIQLAALSRVAGGIVLSDAYLATVLVSGLCWSLAFGIFSVRYWPVLSRPRLDGKPG